MKGEKREYVYTTIYNITNKNFDTYPSKIIGT